MDTDNEKQHAAMLIDERQQAKLIGVSVAFLRKDRLTVRRIPFIRLGGRILYDPARVHQALLAFEQGGQQKRSRVARTDNRLPDAA
jgi:hypothetical protein